MYCQSSKIRDDLPQRKLISPTVSAYLPPYHCQRYKSVHNRLHCCRLQYLVCLPRPPVLMHTDCHKLPFPLQTTSYNHSHCRSFSHNPADPEMLRKKPTTRTGLFGISVPHSRKPVCPARCATLPPALPLLPLPPGPAFPLRSLSQGNRLLHTKPKIMLVFFYASYHHPF